MVNILISTYNGKDYLIEQLDSILKQTYSDFHLYIRDDGSTDETTTLINDYIKNNHLQNKITFIQGTNVGFCSSFFELLRIAEDGEYWAFCDQDDVWFPNKLQLAIEWMESRVNRDIPLLYHSGFYFGNEDLSVKKIYTPPRFNYCFYNSLTCNLFFGFSTVINRALYERLVRANPENVKYHDWFAAMICVAFGECFFSEDVCAIHRLHKNNASPLFFLKKIPDGLRLLKGDNFYNQNAQEFMSLFGQDLETEQREILAWFLNEKYSLKLSCKKAFYIKRWNPNLCVEIVLRILMLFGRV